MSRTRWYPAQRLTGAAVAPAAATGWALDRLGLLADPLAGAEEAVVARPWSVVAGLALVAAGCWAADRRRPSRPARDEVPVPAAR
ncbi:hypothetical protein ACI798_09300 [Geodermatophilus sp. SYSU D01045]